MLLRQDGLPGQQQKDRYSNEKLQEAHEKSLELLYGSLVILK